MLSETMPKHGIRLQALEEALLAEAREFWSTPDPRRQASTGSKRQQKEHQTKNPSDRNGSHEDFSALVPEHFYRN